MRGALCALDSGLRQAGAVCNVRSLGRLQCMRRLRLWMSGTLSASLPLLQPGQLAGSDWRLRRSLV